MDDDPERIEFVDGIQQALPQGSIPMYCVYVIGFLDPFGRQQRRWFIDGDIDIDSVVAGLEIAKSSYVNDHLTNARDTWD